MTTLNVYELTQKRALITRGLAIEIGDALADAWEDNVLTVDFRGIDAVTPSFVDEVLRVADKVVQNSGRADAKVVFQNLPTRLSEKFAAVGRAHQLRIVESEDGTWLLTSGDKDGSERHSA